MADRHESQSDQAIASSLFAPDYLVQGPLFPYHLLPIRPHLYGGGQRTPLFSDRICRSISDHLFIIHHNFQNIHCLHSEMVVELVPGSVAYRIKPRALRRLIGNVLGLNLTLRSLACRIAPGIYTSMVRENLGLMFEQLGLRHVDPPEGVHDLRVYTDHFPTQSAALGLVSDTELWVEFTKLLCGLVAHMINAPFETRFSPELFQSCRSVITAHNRYLEDLGLSPNFQIQTSW